MLAENLLRRVTTFLFSEEGMVWGRHKTFFPSPLTKGGMNIFISEKRSSVGVKFRHKIKTQNSPTSPN